MRNLSNEGIQNLYYHRKKFLRILKHFIVLLLTHVKSVEYNMFVKKLFVLYRGVIIGLNNSLVDQ